MHICNNPSCHNPLHCFLPPHVIDRLTESEDPEIRRLAIDAKASAAAARAVRSTLATMPMMAAIPSPAGTKYRLVYNAENRRFPLPGTLVRSEGDPPVTDEAVNEAYDYSGVTYDFYKDIFGRNSLDNRGMSLISSVHFGSRENNAFWTGDQMLYGDGDGRLFISFTKAIDVVAHELTHGVITNTSNLKYELQSGALNEHFADAMGAMVKQKYLNQTVDRADWLNGDAIMGPGTTAKSLRTFKEGKAYENDPLLDTDPQPKHMRDFVVLPNDPLNDNGGVHINSGIPNHAFYRVALEIGGNAWDKTGKIWYQTLLNLNIDSEFQEAASMTHMVAGSMFGAGSLEQQAVKNGWNAVGITV
ncbi:M4 family metallopeptidase [Merismopedia glauca]|uniref:Neutral metalloproteinase n=1 Tax=Merismopedia glauca CCAP 1448/3 TaxID=1296344 RepID=A0A2T1C9W9_9CYAN|nr:M4 family metallopeptidase [Merismopedia glauca]PSB04947.1 peptidase M4 [Merismopedia glauca CCAP 1448/3]